MRKAAAVILFVLALPLVSANGQKGAAPCKIIMDPSSFTYILKGYHLQGKCDSLYRGHLLMDTTTAEGGDGPCVIRPLSKAEIDKLKAFNPNNVGKVVNGNTGCCLDGWSIGPDGKISIPPRKEQK